MSERQDALGTDGGRQGGAVGTDATTVIGIPEGSETAGPGRVE